MNDNNTVKTIDKVSKNFMIYRLPRSMILFRSNSWDLKKHQVF